MANMNHGTIAELQRKLNTTGPQQDNSDDDSDDDYIKPVEGAQTPTKEKSNSERFKGRTPLPPPHIGGVTPPVRRPSDAKHQSLPRRPPPPLPPTDDEPSFIPEFLEEETEYLTPSSPQLPPRAQRSNSQTKAVLSPLSTSPSHPSNVRGSQISVSSSRSSVSSIGSESPQPVLGKSPSVSSPPPIKSTNEGRALPPTPQPGREKYPFPNNGSKTNESFRRSRDNDFKPEKAPRKEPLKAPNIQTPDPPPLRAPNNDDVFQPADKKHNTSGGRTDPNNDGRPLPLIPPNNNASMDPRSRKTSLQESITIHKLRRNASETSSKASVSRIGHLALPNPINIDTQAIRNVRLKPTAKSLFEKQEEKAEAQNDSDADDNNNQKGVDKLAAKFEKGQLNKKPMPAERGPMPTPAPVKKEATPPPVDLKQPNRDSGFESGSATVVRGGHPTKDRPAIATPDEQLLQKQPWYIGAKTREQSEPMLTNSLDGTFIIRDSTKSIAQPYTLEVWFQGKIRRLPIRKRTDHRFALGTPKDEEESFDSLQDLVSHHQQNMIMIKGIAPDSGDGQASGGALLRRSPPKHN